MGTRKTYAGAIVVESIISLLFVRSIRLKVGEWHDFLERALHVREFVHLGTTYPLNSTLRPTPPQPYSPVGLDLGLLNQPLKMPPKVPVAWSPERPSFGVSPARGSAALGAVIGLHDWQVYTVEGIFRRAP